MIAKTREYSKEQSYKVYVTDHLSAIIHNERRWIDIISGEKSQTEKNEDEAEQIVKALRDNFYGKGDKS